MDNEKEKVDELLEKVGSIRRILEMNEAEKRERRLREYIGHKRLRPKEHFFAFFEAVLAVLIIASIALNLWSFVKASETSYSILIAIFSSIIFGIIIDVPRRLLRGFKHAIKRKSLEEQYPVLKKYSMHG